MSEHSSSLAVLLKRLEAATTRLEELAVSKNKATITTDKSLATEADSNEDAPVEFVESYETMVVPSIEKYLVLSSKVGDVVEEQSKVVKEILLDQQRRFLVIASKSKKPSSQDEINTLFESSQASLEGLMKHSNTNRPSPLFDHLSTVSSGIASASWVLVSPDTAVCVKEMADSSQFYANRVIKAFKEGDRTHVDWANSFVTVLKSLYEYVNKYHKTGLTWNPKGQDVSSTVGNIAEKPSSFSKPSPPPKPAALRSASGSSKGGIPPPPPPPPPGALMDASAPKEPDFNSMFGEINKGDAITSGLKKVDPSQMTHKNPSLRKEGGAVSVVPPRSTSRPVAKQIKEPETTLSGHKWSVQHHTSGTVTIEPTELKQIVYIFNCQNTTIQIKGKCNGVVLDTCKKSGVVLDTAMASIDVINSQSCQLQILQTTPTIVIDKTDGLQLYLSEECLDIEILTAKSSQINILVPQKLPNGEEDFAEKAVPEQFKTTLKDGKLITTSMEHE